MRVRHLTIKAFDDLFGCCNQVFGLGPEVVNWPDNALYILKFGLSKRPDRAVRTEKPRGDLIDFFVGALRREHHGDQELIVIGKL